MTRRRFKKSGISDGLESGGQKKAFPHAERPTLTLSHPGATLASDFKISWKSSRPTPCTEEFFRFISDPEHLYQAFSSALAASDPLRPVSRMSLRDRLPPYTPRGPAADMVQASGDARTQCPAVQDGPMVAGEPLPDRQYQSTYRFRCHQPCRTQLAHSSRTHGVPYKHSYGDA